MSDDSTIQKKGEINAKCPYCGVYRRMLRSDRREWVERCQSPARKRTKHR